MPDRLSAPRWYFLTAVLFSVLAVGAASIGYTNWSVARQRAQQRENDHRWCVLLLTLDAAYVAQPPQTPTGLAIARSIHDLRQKLCG
jgi:hypothetical protein